MKRRIISIFTALALCLSLCPAWALAAEDEPDAGLCDHHREHTADCGGTAPTPCGHRHTAECYPQGALPDADGGDYYKIGADAKNPPNCRHAHDSACGYVPGAPCGFVCRLCPIEDLIAALPDAATADNGDEVRARLDEILALYRDLTEEQQGQLDLSRVTALQRALDPANAPAPAGDPVVKINDVTLEDGKRYVAAENGVAEAAGELGADTPYLEYSGGALTVHGAFQVDGTMVAVNADLTITGGAGSSLKVNAPTDKNAVELDGSALTLAGGVDVNFTSGSCRAMDNVSRDRSGCSFNTTNDYSGNIVVRGGGSVAVNYVRLNVQNSSSITFTSAIFNSDEPVALNSNGDINISAIYFTGLFDAYPDHPMSAKIKGANVEIAADRSYPAVFTGKSLDIEATGDVTISSDIPIGGYPTENPGGLTVKNAKNVSITGRSTNGNPFFPIPVTFENCGNITVTDNGDGKFMAEDVTVTSDKPWTATTGGKSSTMPAGSWTDGGDIGDTSNTAQYMIKSNVPVFYRAGEGRIFYEPAAAEGGAAVTLDGASFDERVFIFSLSPSGTPVPLRMELKGENQMEISTTSALTLTGTGSFAGELLATGEFTNNSTGALNAVVGVTATSSYRYTVYGEYCTSNFNLMATLANPLTIAEGAVLTVDTVNGLTITDPAGLINNGTIINNSGIKILADENADDAAVSALIESLQLTGIGVVSVVKGDTAGAPTETYSNDGKKLLDPAGELDLSSADTDDTTNWDAKGYKWDVQADADGKITSGTLTLAEGFNATKVTLPDAAVTIVTEGRSRIGELAPGGGGSGPQKTALTFSGTGLLSVDKRMEFSGGNNNSMTVSDGAEVVASSGVSIGASGVDGVITVNGALTAAQGEGSCAIQAGKVAVGNTGVLEISGEYGVQLCGVTDGGSTRFEDLFTVTGEGRFTADCSEYNVMVQAPGDAFPVGTTAEGAIRLSEEFLPADCEQKLAGTVIHLVKKGTEVIYTGRITIHKNHTWNEAVWASDSSAHWHPCVFEGCDKRDSEAAHTLSEEYMIDSVEHWQTCTVCGHETDKTAHSAAGAYGHDETNHWETCICGQKLDSEEAHAFGEEYTFDSAGHWRTCTVCGYETGRAAHTYDDGSDTDCNDCGYVRTVSPGGDSGDSGSSGGGSGNGGGGNGGSWTGGGWSGGWNGGGSVSKVYAITVEKSEHGKVTANRTTASSGSAVTLTVTPDSGYALDTLIVTDSQGNEIQLTDKGGGKYAFTMPGRAVTVRAAFAPLPDDRQKPCDGGAECPSYGFTDLGGAGTWYHEAVDYVLRNGLMDGCGEGTFGPNNNLTRAQFAQILFNKEGRPAVNYLLQYGDVADSAWYAEAVRWAASQGIVGGYGDGMFGPNDSITREQLAVMLWRYAGSPAATDKELHFTDADKAGGYALEALRWAVENGVMSGKGGGVLEPQGNATRAEAAAMLMRVLTR